MTSLLTYLIRALSTQALNPLTTEILLIAYMFRLPLDTRTQMREAIKRQEPADTTIVESISRFLNVCLPASQPHVEQLTL
jgi:hypothetical protein